MAGAIWMVSSLMIGITLIALMFILLKYGTRKEHFIWAFFNLGVGVWGLGSFLAGLAKDTPLAIIYWKIALSGALIAPILFYHVIVVLGDIKRKLLLRILYLYGIIFALLSITGFANIKIVKFYESFYYLKAVDLRFAILATLWIAVILITVVELYNLYRKSSGVRHTQFLYFLIAGTIGFTGAILNALLAISNIIIPLGNALIWIYWLLCTYAIFRHQLMDIEVIVKKSLVFAGLLAAVFAILILPTILIQEYILRTASFAGRIIGLAISGLIIILTMRRIETFLINVTDKYLFQKKYNYKELLKTFTGQVLTVLNLDELMSLTVDKLDDIIKLQSCAVLLFDEEKQQFNVMASHNIKDPSMKLIRPDGIVTFMEETHGYLLISELKKKKWTVPSTIQEIIDNLKAELIIPLVMHEEVIGVLSLGKKKSDEDYDQDDLDILLPLARTLAIAISNAELFIELSKTQADAAQKEKMAVIGTLSAGINHEICNPLGIARGQCEAFLLNMKDGLYKAKSPDELLTKAKEIMAKVIKETDRATAITKKLSGFAKPSKGESELVDVAKEIDEVMGLVGYELKLEKIEVEKHLHKDLPGVFVDRKQFQEVLFNLIRNAGQAIGEKGKIRIFAQKKKDIMEIDIQDTGSGIPEDKLNQLFNPFFTTKDPGKGTGLGLFIVRQVVEKNGGKIYLKETKVGEGTTFTLEFPVATPEYVAAMKAEIAKEQGQKVA